MLWFFNISDLCYALILSWLYWYWCILFCFQYKLKEKKNTKKGHWTPKIVNQTQQNETCYFSFGIHNLFWNNSVCLVVIKAKRDFVLGHSSSECTQPWIHVLHIHVTAGSEGKVHAKIDTSLIITDVYNILSLINCVRDENNTCIDANHNDICTSNEYKRSILTLVSIFLLHSM